MDMKNIILLYGGRSGEHEVSRISAASVYTHINEDRYNVTLVGITQEGFWYLQDKPEKGTGSLSMVENPERLVSVVPGGGLVCGGKRLSVDLIFPVLHGTFGEDGTVQGLLECAGVPYAGAGVLGSAIGMDKEVTKRLWLHDGLPVVPFELARSQDLAHEESLKRVMGKAEERFGLPLFVKPSCAGSSVGASRVNDARKLEDAVRTALSFDTKALIEPCIDAREIECSVIGNADPIAFAPGEIVPSHEFYDYDAKYLDPDGAQLVVPASLQNGAVKEVRDIAVKAYRAVCCEGLARVDFFIDKKNGKIYLNEINTIPGFTSISMFPRMCEASGLPYPELISKIIELGLDRYRERQSVSYKR